MMFRSSVHAVTEALDNTPFITLFIRAGLAPSFQPLNYILPHIHSMLNFNMLSICGKSPSVKYK